MSPNLKLGPSNTGSVAQSPPRGERLLGTGTDLPSIYEIYNDEYDDMCAYAQTLVGSRDRAQDIVQQAFTNTLTAVERGATIRNAAAFLNRCVRNLAFDYGREQPVLSLDDEIYRLKETSTAACVELKERWRKVESVVEDLVPSQRYAFLLAEVRGLGYDEIANRMSCSTDAVRMLLCRARRRVRSGVGTEHDLGGVLPILTAQPVLLGKQDSVQHGPLTGFKNKLSELHSWLSSFSQQNLEPIVQPAAPIAAGVIVVALTVGPISSIVGPGTGSSEREIVTPGAASHSVDGTEHRVALDQLTDMSGDRSSTREDSNPPLDRNNPSEADDSRGNPQSKSPPESPPNEGESASLPKKKESKDGSDDCFTGCATQYYDPPPDPGCPTCKRQEAPHGGGGGGVPAPPVEAPVGGSGEGDPNGEYGKGPNGGGDPNGQYEEDPITDSPIETKPVEEPVGGGERVPALPIDAPVSGDEDQTAPVPAPTP